MCAFPKIVIILCNFIWYCVFVWNLGHIWANWIIIHYFTLRPSAVLPSGSTRGFPWILNYPHQNNLTRRRILRPRGSFLPMGIRVGSIKVSSHLITEELEEACSTKDLRNIIMSIKQRITSDFQFDLNLDPMQVFCSNLCARLLLIKKQKIAWLNDITPCLRFIHNFGIDASGRSFYFPPTDAYL